MLAHGTDREALTPVAAPRRITRRKTPTPPKMKAPASCLGRTVARTPPTAKLAPPAPVKGAAALLAWEQRRMRCEVRATANRLANFDDANLRRSARAAVAAGARANAPWRS